MTVEEFDKWWAMVWRRSEAMSSARDVLLARGLKSNAIPTNAADTILQVPHVGAR